jgi:alpha-ketoglutarate-dependent taurine dioxygenase
LLKELVAHATKPEFVYTHKWQKGDLLLWDNCVVQHNAVSNYDWSQHRRIHRTTLAGTETLAA